MPTNQPKLITEEIQVLTDLGLDSNSSSLKQEII